MPVGSALIGLPVAVGGIVGRVVAVGAGVALGVGVALGLGLGDTLGDALGEAEALGDGLAGAALLVTFEEQIARAPPPLAEPLHWLIARAGADATVPVALQVRPTSVPPLADPLHWVIVAPVVVAGNGLHPVVMPPPDPTHWLTVAAVEPGLTPAPSYVTVTLHRSVPPPPLIASLHWLIEVTS